MTVRTGLDCLLEEQRRQFAGARCGLLCHPAAVNGALQSAPELLRDAGAQLLCLFGPEHGVRGEAQDMVGVESGVDARLGIPVYSLYGFTPESLRPQPAWLEPLDLLIIDVQDVGSRYYTYVWTMLMALEACAAAGCRVIVLDRPNPLGGVLVEGPGIEPGFTSFVGLLSVAIRHGLTVGELARFGAAARGLSNKVDLHVVRMEGWRRQQYFDETGLPWVLPSPNMPTLETALVYPGGCLIEGTNLSEGRGTTRPFELIGAPWVDGWALAAALAEQAAELPGVLFRPTNFRPTFHKYAGAVCGGVQLHITSRSTFRPLRTVVALLLAAHRLWPEAFGWRTQAYEFVEGQPAIDLLAGGTWLREGVERDASLAELLAGWTAYEQGFLEQRASYLLYE